MLYTIVFLSGAVLMALEMIGSRLLAPTFGSSIYVWGALITTVMAALTLGYYLGGKAADRRPSMTAMGLILGAAGLFVGFLPFWTAHACEFFSALGPRTGSLLASFTFFFPPGILMAMISPFGIKIASRSLLTVGRTAGRLAAVSSAGSIIGTLITSFFLIPLMGVRNIVHALGLILIIISAAACITDLRLRLPVASAEKAAKPYRLLLLFVAGYFLAALVFAFAWHASIPVNNRAATGEERILFAGDSLYHHIQVDQLLDERHLHFDNSFQSAIFINDPLRMVFSYTSYLHLSVVAHPQPRRALFVGLGGGTAQAKFLHDYPSLTRLDAVEIDPRVVTVAEEFFMLPDDPRLQIHTQDGRLFIDRAADRISVSRIEPYDLVVIDAFNADAIPYHLTTREFLTEVRAVLGPDGVVAANIIGCLDGEKGRLLRAISRTFATVFPQIYLFPIGGLTEMEDAYERNYILIATLDPVRRGKEDWLARAASLTGKGWISEDVTSYAECLADEQRVSSAVSIPETPVLTDDYAPVDTLQHGL